MDENGDPLFLITIKQKRVKLLKVPGVEVRHGSCDLDDV